MKLLGSTKKDVDKAKDGEDVPKLTDQNNRPLEIEDNVNIMLIIG